MENGIEGAVSCEAGLRQSILILSHLGKQMLDTRIIFLLCQTFQCSKLVS